MADEGPHADPPIDDLIGDPLKPTEPRHYFIDWLVAPERDADDLADCQDGDKGGCLGCRSRETLRSQVRSELAQMREEGWVL